MSTISYLDRPCTKAKKFRATWLLVLVSSGFVAGWLAMGPILGQNNFLVSHLRSPNLVYNGPWVTSMKVGSSRAPALMRATVAYFGLAANASEEAVYWTGLRDDGGQRLRGGRTYEVRFQTPPAVRERAGFWSLCIYNAADYFVPNPLNRYQLGDRSRLNKNPDGSFTIIVSPDQPKDLTNWLPSPQNDEEITLQLRMYAPLPEVQRQPDKIPMPQVVRVNG